MTLRRHQGMDNQPGPPDTTSPADHRPELLATGESGRRGEHGVAVIRPTARSDPCADGRTGSPGQRGYASAAGTRGSWHDGGCWAGRCACPCSRSVSRLLYIQVGSVSWHDASRRASARQRHPPQTGDPSRVRTNDRPHQIGGTRPCRSAIRLPPGDTCPDELLWHGATLVSVPLLLWARGDLAGRRCWPSAGTLNPRGVRTVLGFDGYCRTFVHSCGQPCGHLRPRCSFRPARCGFHPQVRRSDAVL